MFGLHIHPNQNLMNNLPQVHFSEQDQASVLFEKRAIVELSQDEMMEIDGGTTPLCALGIAAFVGGVAVGRAIYDVTH